MNVNIKPSYLIVALITAILASIVAVRITDYVRDHNEMRRQISEQMQTIQTLEEVKGIHENKAQELQQQVEDLKTGPQR